MQCAITQQEIVSPLRINQCGHTFERADILEWTTRSLAQNQHRFATCPCCRVHYTRTDLQDIRADISVSSFASALSTRYTNLTSAPVASVNYLERLDNLKSRLKDHENANNAILLRLNSANPSQRNAEFIKNNVTNMVANCNAASYVCLSIIRLTSESERSIDFWEATHAGKRMLEIMRKQDGYEQILISLPSRRLRPN